MKKNILLLALVWTSLFALAQIPNGYYDNATGKRGDELKVALHDIIDDHTTITYQQIWNAFWSTDNKDNGIVWDMYSDIPNGTPPYVFHLGQEQCGEYEHESDCYNREHSWPKSWFSGNEQTVPGRDLHHIFPTDGFVNAQRSSYPYGEVNNASWTSRNGSKLGTCKSSLGYTGTVFEPIDEYKGDFARAIMYMSIRYYSEDSDWGSSGMTNKSEIKPWAIQMLMRWSEQDPVSAKEIARNNAIYSDYQHNRNPFVDHPEYARAIWDPDWTGVEYNISYNTVQHGSISGPATAVEGTMVTLTAIPAEGYMIGGWTVNKTGDANTIVSVNSDGTFNMPAFNVTVSANFVANYTYYNITCTTVQNGSISANASTARSGSSITLSATPATGYSLYSWYVYKTGDMNTMVYHGVSNVFTMPTFDVTVTATFVQGSIGDYYAKVTSAPTNWSGEYLIVCENQHVAFNGTVDNNWGRCSAVTITNNTIASNTTSDSYKVTISQKDSGYKFLFPSGKYMSWTGEKKFSESTTQTAYSISLSDGNVSISNGDYTVKYNHNNGSGGLRSYASGQTAIQLYKKTAGTAPVPTHTIHFDSNGGYGTMSDQMVDEYVAIQLNANGFSRSGFEFMGWNTQSDGTGQYYSDGATVSLLGDLILYAQWKQFYSITLANIQNGSVTVSQTQALEGDLIDLIATPDTDYEFDHWNVTDTSNALIPVTDNQFEMPASNVTVDAVFEYVGSPFAQKYHLVTSTNQLMAGRTYLIVNTSAGKALGKTQNDNNRSAENVVINNDNTISMTNIGNACELFLDTENNHWTFFDSTNNGYLYAASSSKNWLRTQTNNNANGEWTITINNGIATITAQGSYTHNLLQYNNSAKIFSCYSSAQQNVQLFILSEEFDHTESETIAHLYPFDKHTIHNGAILTVSGTATCDDASLLNIEDGAQLIHHTNGVKATVKKAITAYTTDGGWYTIATPFTTFNPTGTPMASDSYDLYAYHENDELEWYNYKAHMGDFNIEPSVGYLYAHNPNITLRMTGTLNNGDYSETIPLSFSNSDDSLTGWNLLGNPMAHSIAFTKTANVSDGYYYLNHGNVWVPETESIVPAGRGFLVKANAADQSVTLNTQKCMNKGDEKNQFICLDIDGEQAFVKMTEGVSLPLLSHKGKSSSIWLEHEQKAYSILVRDNADYIDINYKATQAGKHLFGVNAKDIETEYLHLIDHLTDADIDLLTTPSYSFESHKGDSISRFQLRFSPN